MRLWKSQNTPCTDWNVCCCFCWPLLSRTRAVCGAPVSRMVDLCLVWRWRTMPATKRTRCSISDEENHTPELVVFFCSLSIHSCSIKEVNHHYVPTDNGNVCPCCDISRILLAPRFCTTAMWSCPAVRGIWYKERESVFTFYAKPNRKSRSFLCVGCIRFDGHPEITVTACFQKSWNYQCATNTEFTW